MIDKKIEKLIEAGYSDEDILDEWEDEDEDDFEKVQGYCPECDGEIYDLDDPICPHCDYCIECEED